MMKSQRKIENKNEKSKTKRDKTLQFFQNAVVFGHKCQITIASDPHYGTLDLLEDFVWRHKNIAVLQLVCHGGLQGEAHCHSTRWKEGKWGLGMESNEVYASNATKVERYTGW